MSETATRSQGSVTAHHTRDEVTCVTEGNRPPSNWRGVLLVPWHVQSAIHEHGNEIVADLRAWGELADRARRRWGEDNPY